jgi:hypothetical protein
MRIPDNNYHKLARVQFIYADSLSILDNLEIRDKDAYLHYEESATDILLKPGILLKNYLFDIWCENTALIHKITNLQKERRKKLIETHTKYRHKTVLKKEELEDLFNQHFRYEQLAIDKYISEELLGIELSKNLPEKEAQKIFENLLTPYDGKTFFEESNIIRLKHLGNILDPNNHLTKEYNSEWYREKSLTKHRIYDILENYVAIVHKVDEEIAEIKSIFNIKNHTDIIETIKRIRYKQTNRREIIQTNYEKASEISPRIKNYLEIIKIGLPYNEDVRLQRSISFNIFSKNSLLIGENPKELYREFQTNRQKRFALQYRSEKYDEIMTRSIINYLEAER